MAQAISEYPEVCARAGRAHEADQLQAIAQRILADFNRHLMKDGVVAGYGLVGNEARVGPGEAIDVLLHPSDTQTGVRYSLLPMNRGVISGVFSKEQADRHLELIERHLKGPDGARLMDRPRDRLDVRARAPPLRGSSGSRGQGRCLARGAAPGDSRRLRRGRAARERPPSELLLQQLRRPVHEPICSRRALRRVIAGSRRLEGGWRVYSSGPGIYVALVVSRLLGLRVEFGKLIIDPVLTRSLDGLEASLRFRGRPVVFAYHVEGQSFAPRAISVNGNAAQFDYESNAYRQGGAVLPLERFLAMLDADDNRVEIQV